MNTAQSEALLEAAEKVIPGGVNSPVRAFRSVGGTPPFIARGKGAYLFDVDGNRFVDYVSSWGPLVLGHAHPAVVDAVCAAAERGTSYGAPTEAEIELAEMVVNAVSSIEMVRFVSSGTEAVMSALRVARAFTGRTRIVKFDGGYHGHADLLLAQAGSGLATLGLPASAGVPPAVVADTLTVSFNDLTGVQAVFEANPGQIAAIIVEPVAGNMGVVSPQPGFLAGLREVTRRDGALLIFDEVITGFRVAYGGAQALYGVIPDLTCLGKIIGGGLPVGAYGGRRDVMHMVAPLGPAYQAGTLSGNPLAMAAGIATLSQLQKPGVYEYLERLSARLEEGMGQAAREAGAPFSCNRVGSMFTGFFTDGPIVDYASAKRSDTVAYARMFHAMLDAGFYLAPSQFEAGFMSLAHSEEDVAATISAAREAFRVARG